MQLSVDQKIQLAIQPLIDRIAALEAENEKFKQEIASLHTAAQPKTAHKPAPKPPAEPLERPQTVKGGRKKSVQNHEIKPELKTDKKPAGKKQEAKVEGEEGKPENPKHTGSKTPVIANKGVSSPNINKDQNPVNKDTKTKSTAGTGRVSTTNLNNKSIVGDKKPNAKPNEHPEQKKEGEQNHEEKKEHASHEKPEHPKPAHNPKTPPVTKPKPNEVKKPAPGPATTGAAKKGGKPPVKDTKEKTADPKTESPKEETKEQKQEPKEEVKQEVKEEQKPEITDETQQEKKEEEAPPQATENGEHVEHVQPEKEKQDAVVQGENEHKQPPAQDEAL